MDLKTGNLLWPAISAPLVLPPPLMRDLQADVVILGAGVSGAMAAVLLAEAGLDVVVLDRRGVAEGSTPASTALVQYEIDSPLVELASDVGIEPAQRAYRACRAALDDLVELTARHEVHCDLSWCGSLFLAGDPAHADWFVREAAARQAIGIEVEPLSRRELIDRFDIDRAAALHSAAAIELDPFKLTHGLMHAAERLGVRVYHAEATPERLDDGGVSLRTNLGVVARCDHLIIATGYETPEYFSAVAPYCRLKSTYALASEPLEGVSPWPGRVMLWESGHPYLYARQTVDNRVIVGGEDEPFVDPDQRDALIEEKTRTLIEKFELLRPDVEIRAEMAWAGTFAETADGLPLIGQHHRYPRCHFALGYGGNGITFGLLAAQILRDAIQGKQNAVAEVFRFDR